MTQAAEVASRMQSLEHGYVLEAQGLSVTRDLERREWVTCGQEITRRVEGSTWALGDWLIYGGRTGRNWLGGSTYEKAVEITGYTAAHLSNVFRVAVAYPPDTRLPTLSWSVHREATRAPAELRAALLKKAEEKRWTADDVIQHINSLIEKSRVKAATVVPLKARTKKPHRTYYAGPKVRCPKCNHEFTIKGHKVGQGDIQ
jgi:hypothetical protein